MSDKPIGVFDSGVGGLTAVRELRNLLPGEDIVYFGDTGRVPYGTRSRQTILKYSQQAIKFLVKHDVKAIIAACGTVSSVLEEKMVRDMGMGVPYTGIVLPAVRTACAMSSGGRVGVIATAAAIRSGAYGRAIRQVSPSAKLFGNACPLLVPIVENGMTGFDNKIARLAVEMYLEPLIREEIDTLILGCTHFPLLYDIINDVMDYKVTLIDPSASAARELKNELCRHGLFSKTDKPGRSEYYVTDSVESFEKIAEAFLQEPVAGLVTHIDIEAIEN